MFDRFHHYYEIALTATRQIPRFAALAVVAFFSCAGAHAVTIDTVLVGNPGNPGDAPGSNGLRFGSIDYNYRIGKYEVTAGQYAEFLNAVAATDTYELYSPLIPTELIARSGSSDSYSYSLNDSPDSPMSFVSWVDAARFANWLHNGQPTGPQGASTTEDGAYTINGATTDEALNVVSRNPSAIWFIPSEDEWHKAAYHKNDGVTGNYWDYPTSTDSRPFSVQPPGSAAPDPSNTANFLKDDGIANGYDDVYVVTGSTSRPFGVKPVTNVGAYTSAISPYGTFDQEGNVWEWTEGFRLQKPALPCIVRGGGWGTDLVGLRASNRFDSEPHGEGNNIGFRVASYIPLQAGDADQDLDFEQRDLVQVQVAAKYLTGRPSTWGDGDWDGAPGGSPGNPPLGDGLFNQWDIVVAQQGAKYLTGPYAAVQTGGTIGDGQTSIIYNAGTGEL